MQATQQLHYYVKQEAQLSQRERTPHRVIEYFAKSHKVIRNKTLEKGVSKYLLVFHFNYVCTSYRF